MLFPINEGWSPDFDSRVNNSNLKGWFVGDSGLCYSQPNLLKQKSLTNALAMLLSEDGTVYIIEKGKLLVVNKDGEQIVSKPIETGLLPIRMAENKDNQLLITNGTNAFVYNKKTQVTTKLGVVNGFDLVEPYDVMVINTIAIFVGHSDKKWVYTDANNALKIAGEVNNTDQSFGKLTACVQLDNSIYIFGENGVQRWVPSISRTSFSSPFTIDNNYRNSYGCLATMSAYELNNVIYYLTNNYNVATISLNGLISISSSGQAIVLSKAKNIERSLGFTLDYIGHYFYGLTVDSVTYLYSTESKKWCLSNDVIIGGDSNIAITDVSLSKLSPITATTYHSLTTSPLEDVKEGNKITVTTVSLDIVQGQDVIENDAYFDMSIANDNSTYTNVIRKPISKIGNRQHRLIWNLKMTELLFSFKFDYFGNVPMTVKRLIIN